jgi:hypothetical protein
VEEDNGSITENDGAAAAASFEGEGRGGEAAGFAERTGIDVSADADGADVDFAAAFEDLR